MRHGLVGAALLLITLSGCGSVPVSEAYGPLVGKDVSVAITQMGKPDNVYTENGMAYYSWKVERQAGGFTGAMFGGVFAFTQRGNCLITLSVNPATNTITGYGIKAIDGKPGACELSKDDD